MDGTLKIITGSTKRKQHPGKEEGTCLVNDSFFIFRQVEYFKICDLNSSKISLSVGTKQLIEVFSKANIYCTSLLKCKMRHFKVKKKQRSYQKRLEFFACLGFAS